MLKINPEDTWTIPYGMKIGLYLLDCRTEFESSLFKARRGSERYTAIHGRLGWNRDKKNGSTFGEKLPLIAEEIRKEQAINPFMILGVGIWTMDFRWATSLGGQVIRNIYEIMSTPDKVPWAWPIDKIDLTNKSTYSRYQGLNLEWSDRDFSWLGIQTVRKCESDALLRIMVQDTISLVLEASNAVDLAQFSPK